MLSNLPLRTLGGCQINKNIVKKCFFAAIFSQKKEKNAGTEKLVYVTQRGV